MNLTKYKLGDLIVQRREKNNNYDVPIRGVSKEGFIPAKQKDADTSIYNVFYKYDFVFNPARMELNSIALNLEYDKALCSSLYEVFYVKDESIVLPEFLNLHIKRDEFARHCDYIGLGSAREYCRFANIAEFDIELPPIEVQEEIVEADRLIKKRIRLNNQMIQHLEATAQALYRKTFVDNIDKENLPEGWRMGTLTDIATYLNGTACQKYETKGQDYLPVLKIRELSQGRCDENSDHVDVSIPQDYIINTGDVIFSWSATLFIDIWCGGKCALNQHLFKVTSSEFPKWFYFLWTQNHIAEWKRLISAKATSMGHIKREDLDAAQVIIPSKKCLMELNEKMHPIFEMYILKKQENLKLTELQSLLLAKMGR